MLIERPLTNTRRSLASLARPQFVVLKEGKAECTGCYKTVLEANEDGAVTLNYGSFIHSITSFLFMSLILFLIYRSLKQLRQKVEKELKDQGIISKRKKEIKEMAEMKGTSM